LKNWIEVKAEFQNEPEDWSIYIEAFDRIGCEETLQTDNPFTLSAYLEDVAGTQDRVERLTADLKDLGASGVFTQIVPDEDWAENWKQFFKVRHVGEHLVIVPTWEEYEPKPGETVITLDPGQAFGTGDHPTTRLSLTLLEQADPRDKSVADIGCGSGVLAIAACKLGAHPVVASDLDEQSVEITRQNATLNQVDFPAFVAAGFDSLTGPQDIVLSNIISATLMRLAPDAKNFVKPGGVWIVSGIIEQNWDDVKAKAEAAGFQLETKLQEDEWVGATFRL
jgi:ribosomal protein L11 methyltransferase